MTEEIKNLPFDRLRALHLEIGALLAEKRSEALADLKQKAELLGFTAADFAPVKKRRGRKGKEPKAAEPSTAPQATLTLVKNDPAEA